MDALSLLNHLLNFFAPALAVGGLLALAARMALPGLARGRSLAGAAGLNAGVGSLVLVAGLLVFGRDGRMLTYGALVLACASSQWLWLRAWRG